MRAHMSLCMHACMHVYADGQMNERNTWMSACDVHACTYVPVTVEMEAKEEELDRGRYCPPRDDDPRLDAEDGMRDAVCVLCAYALGVVVWCWLDACNDETDADLFIIAEAWLLLLLPFVLRLPWLIA